jgi:hypothetical protein
LITLFWVLITPVLTTPSVWKVPEPRLIELFWVVIVVLVIGPVITDPELIELVPVFIADDVIKPA